MEIFSELLFQLVCVHLLTLITFFAVVNHSNLICNFMDSLDWASLSSRARKTARRLVFIFFSLFTPHHPSQPHKRVLKEAERARKTHDHNRICLTTHMNIFLSSRKQKLSNMVRDVPLIYSAMMIMTNSCVSQHHQQAAKLKELWEVALNERKIDTGWTRGIFIQK